jgi:hypothetical protein
VVKILFEHQIQGFGGGDIITSSDFGHVLLSLGGSPFFPANQVIPYNREGTLFAHMWIPPKPWGRQPIKVTIMADPPTGARIISCGMYDGRGLYSSRRFGW